jgi:hypothetical protein
LIKYCLSREYAAREASPAPIKNRRTVEDVVKVRKGSGAELEKRR